MNTISRWTPYRGLNSLQEQVNRLFDDTFGSNRAAQSDLATWAPAVDVFETENELVVKADLPDMNEKDIDVRVENNTLTVRGERKFEQQASEDNYLRIERAYGTFTRSFSLPNTRQSRGDSRRIPQWRLDGPYAQARRVQAQANQDRCLVRRKIGS